MPRVAIEASPQPATPPTCAAVTGRRAVCNVGDKQMEVTLHLSCCAALQLCKSPGETCIHDQKKHAYFSMSIWGTNALNMTFTYIYLNIQNYFLWNNVPSRGETALYLCGTEKVCPINCNYFLVLSVSILEMCKDRQIRISGIHVFRHVEACGPAVLGPEATEQQYYRSAAAAAGNKPPSTHPCKTPRHNDSGNFSHGCVGTSAVKATLCIPGHKKFLPSFTSNAAK